MATYVPGKKNTEYIFYISLVSQSNTKLFQVNPTLAAGDVKVKIDTGAYNNLGTLPSAEPAASSTIKVTLSAAEMNGDNIAVLFSDASGSEWCDLLINIQTTTKQVDDLAVASTALTNGMWTDAKAALVDVAISSRNATTPPTVAAIADAVLDEALSGHNTAGTVGKGISDASAAGDPWDAAVRTLTQTAAQVAAAVTGSALVITRYTTFRATLNGLSLTGTQIYFAIKRSIGDSDDNSLVFISLTGGLSRINATAATTAANGSITVDGDDLIIYLDETETAKLNLCDAIYSVKRINSGDALAVTAGAATIIDEAIKAIT